jgi:SAM-dependent methyltransferase
MLAVERLLSLQEADLNERLPFENGSFDAAMSLDVVLHLRDRERFFREVARVLSPGGRFLVTDAGVVTGCVSNEAIRKRSVHGYTQFVASGWNEALLESTGFRVIETEDRTASVLRNASGRLAAMEKHRAELEQLSGAAAFQAQKDYLEVVVDLARLRAVSRMMYLAEVQAEPSD